MISRPSRRNLPSRVYGRPAQTTANAPLNENEIRILVLFPSSNHDAPLEGRRERQELSELGESTIESDPRSYEAISYIWGSRVYESSILVDGVRIPITWNLQLALQDLRHEKKERRVWVDCVSINMSDLKERAHTILNMRRIFQGASQVLVWLGAVSGHQRMALPFLEEVAKAADADDVLRCNDLAAGWDSVRQLLLQPYFTRAWVFQEIAVARRATLFARSDSIDWRVFAAAIAIFDKRCLLYPAELLDYNQVQIQEASRFVRTVRESFHRDEFGNAQDPALSLEKLVFELAGSHVSDPRDKIYDLLAIAADIDSNQPQIKPDYSKPLEDVYLEFYRFCVASMKTLDVVFRPWGKHHYIPPWVHRPNDSELAAPLVKAPEKSQPFLSGIATDSYLKVNDMGILEVKGYILDHIDDTSSPHDTWDVPLPRAWLNSVQASQIAEALLSDYWPEYNDSKIELVRCFKRAFDESSDEESFSMIVSRHSHLTSVFKHIKTLTWGRRLFRTDVRYMIGLAPIGAKKGDLLCFVPSCSVPIVLRKIDASEADDSYQRYALIGACYLGGHMKGGFPLYGPEEIMMSHQFDILPAAQCQGLGVPVYDDSDGLSPASSSP